MTEAKPVRKSPKAAAASPRLTREDWLDAAFESVVEGGFDAARVLPLSQRLGVTRGSFYWHFKDHAELIDDLLKRWVALEEAADQELVAIHTENPQDDLMQVLVKAFDHAGEEQKNMRFELALRGLGRRDPQVAKILGRVDRNRLTILVQKFVRITGDMARAGDYAALFYLAMVGCYQALARPNTSEMMRQYLKDLLNRLLIVEAGKSRV